MEPSTDNNPNPIEEPTLTPEPVTEKPVSEVPASEPTDHEPTDPEPTPEPDPESVPEPAPEPAPEPTPESTSESVPEPTSESTADSVVEAEEPKPKNNRPPTITMAAILIALIIAGGFAFAKLFPFSQNGQPSGQGGSNSGQSQNYDLSSMSDFDLAFLRLQDKQKNVIYSPLSIKYALAMLSDAAAGESKTQITNLIGDYTPKTYTNNINRSFANAMFIRERVKDGILSSYTTTLRQKYNAEVVYDLFASAAPINQWISNKTMGIIHDMLSEDALQEDTDFMLINALAIDMEWNNQLQCARGNEKDMPCKTYNPIFKSEKYDHYIPYVGLTTNDFEKINFNGEETESAKIGVSANRYDIVKELGEDYIRSTVLAAYEEWKVEENGGEEDEDFDIDEYMEALDSNYGQIYTSTDFYYSDNSDEIVFAKDLKTYDDSTLQYVGIMPKTGDLGTYTDSLTVEKLSSLINGIKDASIVDSYKNGVVTQLEGYIPFFKYNYKLELKSNLEELGITDVFDKNVADLSNLTSIAYSYIQDALHKADIDFSNDGIKAAAATAIAGGLGAGGPIFIYKWEVPIEKIDITIDKPFFFIIRDKSTGEIWFTGTVYNPAA